MKITRQDIGRQVFSKGLNRQCRPVVCKAEIAEVRADGIVIKTGKVLVLTDADSLYPTRSECAKAIDEQPALF